MNDGYLINYINNKINEINSKFPNYISEQQRESFIKNNVIENMSESEVQDKINFIDQLFEQIIKQQEKIQELRKELARELRKKKEEKLEQPKIFGQTYKSNLIEIFKMYDEIQKIQNLSDSEKKELLESQISEFIPKSKEEFRKFLMMQTQDQTLIEYGMKAMFLGYETLNYDTISNLKEIFDRNLNLVQCESEGKLKMILPGNQQIFDSNGNINSNLQFDFSHIKTIYDYARDNGKQIKHHELLWHNSVPENLKKEVETVDRLSITEQEKQSLKRNMCLKFYDYYFKQLSNFFVENNYDIRQIDVLNEIANDLSPLEYKKLSDELIKLEHEAQFDTNPETIKERNQRIDEINNKLKNGENILRESFWSQNIGNNPQNGDAYFIDILRMAKKYFPNSDLIYNDYNEFIGYKCDRMCEIIKYIQSIEQRDGIKLIDGLGLQAHYRDFVPELGRNLTQEDIMGTAVKFMKLGIPLYITEFDFKNVNKIDVEPFIKLISEIYGIAANGFDAWGNSDHLTWEHCLDKSGNYMDPHIVDEFGNKKKFYDMFYNNFMGLTNEKNNTENELSTSLDQLKQLSKLSTRQMLELYSKDPKYAGIKDSIQRQQMELLQQVKQEREQFEPIIIEHLKKSFPALPEQTISKLATEQFYCMSISKFLKPVISQVEKEYGTIIPEDKMEKFKGLADFKNIKLNFNGTNAEADSKNGQLIFNPNETLGTTIEEKIVMSMGVSIHEAFHLLVNMNKSQEQAMEDSERLKYIVSTSEGDKEVHFAPGKYGQVLNEGFVEKMSSEFAQRNGFYCMINPRYIPYVDVCSKIMDHDKSITQQVLFTKNGDAIREKMSPDIRTKYEEAERIAVINHFSVKEADKDSSLKNITSDNVKESWMEKKGVDLPKTKNDMFKGTLEIKREEKKENNNFEVHQPQEKKSEKMTPAISVKKGPEAKFVSFTRRSESEIQIANQIKQKNTIKHNENIAKKTMDKPKTLVKKQNTFSNSSSSGFVDVLILTLITGFVAGAIFMIVYNILK